MKLVDYQEELAKQIYDILINSEYGTNINLYGKTGNGKTTIGLGITEYLKENWKIFYLCGINEEMSPSPYNQVFFSIYSILFDTRL